MRMDQNQRLSSVVQTFKQKGNELRRAISVIPAPVLDTPFKDIPKSLLRINAPLTRLGTEAIRYFTPTYWNFLLGNVKPGLLTVADTSGNLSDVEPDEDESIPSTQPLATSTPFPSFGTPPETRRLPQGPPVLASRKGIIAFSKKQRETTMVTTGESPITATRKRRLFHDAALPGPSTSTARHNRSLREVAPAGAEIRNREERIFAFYRRHRRMLKPNMLTFGDVKRLARRGGVKRLSHATRIDVNNALRDFLGSVVQRAVVYADYAKRNTITTTDVTMALKSIGQTLYL
jgi:histone H4